MKKNFLTAAAIMVVAFFVSTEIARAADITFSGQIRTRWELNEHIGEGGVAGANAAGSFDNNTDEFIFSSVRLAANANINDTTTAFIQLQSVRNWGDSSSMNKDFGAGSGNASRVANDKDSSVGVHQAYFTLKNLGDLPIAMDAKIGRQEIILDGHRLFGNTVWTPGMQSHDAIRMTHAHDNMSLNLAYIRAQEDGRTNDPEDNNDSNVWVAHLNLKGVLGGQFSAIYAYVDNGGRGLGFTNGENNFSTIGGRQAGQLFGLDYRAEAYYQFGRADGVVKPLNVVDLRSFDRSAYMFGVRVGKTFKNVMFKPGITLWYDYLSGTTDQDLRDGNFSSFDTLYDTGHKFYGLQDLFLGVGQAGSTGTNGLGLQDIAIKFKLNPMPGWTVKLDAHAFVTAERPRTNPLISRINRAKTQAEAPQGIRNRGIANDSGSYLGNEIDLTMVNKYNANTNIMLGFSNFNGTTTFKQIKAGTNKEIGKSRDANWAYVMFDVKF